MGVTVDLPYLLIQRFFGLIIGILLVYSSLKLLTELKNKEYAISMVFLHKNRIIKLFALLVVAAFFTFLTGFIFVFFGDSIFVEVSLDLNAFTLLIFTFSLQRLMRGVEGKWI